MTVAVLAGWWGVRSGWSPPAVLGLVSFGTIAVVALAERWLPFDPEWNRSRGDVQTDLLHSVLSSYGGRELYKLLFSIALLPAVIWLAGAMGSTLWPAGWPLLAQLALAATVGELGQYWAHRLAHERDLLWRLHATHHSPERLYWLNAGRDHPLGVLLLWSATALPLILLGCPAECLTLFYVIEAVHGLFQHANVDVRLGPLNWLFSMAELHRWHHSSRLVEANHNYGATLILWDVVFGTRYLPERSAPEVIGIPDIPNFPRDFLGQLAVPFRWAQLKAAALPVSPPSGSPS